MQASDAASDTSWLAKTLGPSFSVFLICLTLDSYETLTQKNHKPQPLVQTL